MKRDLCGRGGLRRGLAAGLFLASAIASASWGANGTLQIQVTDGETGKPMRARVSLRMPEGELPGDRIMMSSNVWPNIEARGIYIDGATRLEVPAGEVSVWASHGLEYRAGRKTVGVAAGENQSVELSLDRAVNLRELGWVSGDAHVHMIHGENERPTSYEDVALVCEAAGLDFVAVGQEYSGAGKFTLEDYHAACRSVSRESFQMFLGGERPKSLLGHQAMLNVSNPFLYDENPPYFQTARKIHEAGGVLFYVHPVRYFPQKKWNGQWLDFPGNNLGRELIFDAFCGPSFDGLSVISDEPDQTAAHQLWFNLLNRGWFVPAFADSDACFDRKAFQWHAPGFWVTYFFIGPGRAVTSEAVARAVREGRTFATTGPIALFSIDRAAVGDSLPPDGTPRVARIAFHYPQHAWSLEPAQVKRVELLRNGRAVQSWSVNASSGQVEFEVRESKEGWYAARVFGEDARWQVAVTSPIYFRNGELKRKAEPLQALARGRIYDFQTGEPRAGEVSIWEGDRETRRFTATNQFSARMPLDATIRVEADGVRSLERNLLMDFGPIHQFLWRLDKEAMGRAETLNEFERLASQVELEFPLGFKLPGCYVAQPLGAPLSFQSVEILESPPKAAGGDLAVAAILTDAEQVAAGGTFSFAAIFRDEGLKSSESVRLIVEARGYNPSRPTAYGALKKLDAVERDWKDARDLGGGYRLVTGELRLPEWLEKGPTGAIDLSARARVGYDDVAFVGLQIPVGTSAVNALTVSAPWPTMPIAWPDGNYGLGPFRITGRLGKKGQPLSDYRDLRLRVQTSQGDFDLFPARDGRGCADSDDALYTGHYFDQILNHESNIAKRPKLRPQPSGH